MARSPPDRVALGGPIRPCPRAFRASYGARMSGGGAVVRRAPAGSRSVPPAHRATASRRRSAAIVGVLAALGGAAVTTFLLGPGGGPGAGGPPKPSGTEVDQSPAALETGGITCWDGTSATLVKECGVPSGRAGVATVFPSLDTTCAATSPVVDGKAEVYTCNGGDFVVRYPRWEPGYDRFATFSEDNRGLGSVWTVNHEFAGRV